MKTEIKKTGLGLLNHEILIRQKDKVKIEIIKPRTRSGSLDVSVGRSTEVLVKYYKIESLSCYILFLVSWVVVSLGVSHINLSRAIIIIQLFTTQSNSQTYSSTTLTSTQTQPHWLSNNRNINHKRIPVCLYTGEWPFPFICSHYI